MNFSKSFYYTVDHSKVEEYKKMLDLMKIPYIVEAPIVLLNQGANEYSFVFPNMSGRLYGMVSKLFQADGKPYLKNET
ncbi:hypothetical protein HP567_018825 [Brevibacillus sp. M2.1A]|uniref:hypothetical protein n=1 Tax=Brevibacillus TaxID=55080 RepID=UPI00156B9993|nr:MULTISPECIES: hypothetical protein [Brevibacillus]MBY0087556.1 hypothetical protein [Brevibacillus brevis]MCC8436605.1 hypothetical protein [Brevibacillus sp. M2.1A]MCE0448596.1 hypothetical protein [Brevibacillus sp. AF8]MCM3141083.1 hypothetical protein [Brevibacillus sp. MER 51]UKK98792.1 hypothetical protein FO446_15780 [Brevibacillus brevis]